MHDLSPSGCTVHLAQHHAGTVLQGQHIRRTLDLIEGMALVRFTPARDACSTPCRGKSGFAKPHPNNIPLE